MSNQHTPGPWEVAHKRTVFPVGERALKAGTPTQMPLNRETWLTITTDEMRKHFVSVGHEIPANVVATCGFPSKSALSRKRKRIGECWRSEASDGNVFEIFISPLVSDGLEVAAILAHELCHATVGLDAKHGPKFKKCALAIGLEGKMTATVAGEKFRLWYDSGDFGPYPHARLNAQSDDGTKKQTTRLIKAECGSCADEGTPYIVRLSQSTLDLGAPICPIHNEAMTAASKG